MIGLALTLGLLRSRNRTLPTAQHMLSAYEVDVVSKTATTAAIIEQVFISSPLLFGLNFTGPSGMMIAIGTWQVTDWLQSGASN
jgi:hypothetical protein